MRDALKTLPWVEKDSVKIKGNTATFTVRDPKQFKLEEVQKALKQKGNYSASLLKAGSQIAAQ